MICPVVAWGQIKTQQLPSNTVECKASRMNSQLQAKTIQSTYSWLMTNIIHSMSLWNLRYFIGPAGLPWDSSLCFPVGKPWDLLDLTHLRHHSHEGRLGPQWSDIPPGSRYRYGRGVVGNSPFLKARIQSCKEKETKKIRVPNRVHLESPIHTATKIRQKRYKYGNDSTTYA